VTAATRTATLPQVPTVAESGVPGYEHSIWAGVFAPAGTPQPIVAKVSEDLSRVLKDVEVRKKLAELNVEIAGSTPESFTKFFKVEIDKWAGLLKATGIRGD
jgi:tripartite-type tricarboxylate transporter receptor subunit TctC